MKHSGNGQSLLFHSVWIKIVGMCWLIVLSTVYVKVPENSLSVNSILSAVATKLNSTPEELVILDVKFLQVTDDKGVLARYIDS